MEENNKSISEHENEINDSVEEYIINSESEENAQIENYSLNSILENTSCLLAKEKVYLWENSLFSKKLYEILTAKKDEIIARYKEIYSLIENILMGDFCDASEITDYNKDFFYASYKLKIKIDSNINYLLFVIYFSKKDKKSEYFFEFLEFLNIFEEKKDIQKSLEKFKNEHQYLYSELEYDKHCLLDSKVFFYKIVKNSDGKIIRYPNNFEIINKSDKAKNIERLGEIKEDNEFIDFDI